MVICGTKTITWSKKTYKKSSSISADTSISKNRTGSSCVNGSKKYSKVILWSTWNPSNHDTGSESVWDCLPTGTKGPQRVHHRNRATQRRLVNRWCHFHRALDLLVKNQIKIEDHFFGQAKTLFDRKTTTTLYDVTNTFFEGRVTNHPKARRGRSKDKRFDVALLTLALVVGGSDLSYVARCMPVLQPRTIWA